MKLYVLYTSGQGVSDVAVSYYCHVNLDQLVQVVPDRFLHCKISVFCFFCN